MAKLTPKKVAFVVLKVVVVAAVGLGLILSMMPFGTVF